MQKTRLLFRSFGLGAAKFGCLACLASTFLRKVRSSPLGTLSSSSIMASTPSPFFSSRSSVGWLSLNSIMSTGTPSEAYSACSILKMYSLKWNCSFSLQ